MYFLANHGLVKFTGNWVTFIDSLFHLALIEDLSSDFRIIVGITRFEVDPKRMMVKANDGK